MERMMWKIVCLVFGLPVLSVVLYLAYFFHDSCLNPSVMHGTGFNFFDCVTSG